MIMTIVILTVKIAVTRRDIVICNVARCPAGGSAVPLEHEAGCVCEAGARGPREPCEHSQCEDGSGEHIRWVQPPQRVTAPRLNTGAVSTQRSRRRKCVFNGPEVQGQMFAFPQGTRGLSASPFTSTEHHLGL